MDNTISDEILTAYLDGELDVDSRNEVDAMLATDLNLAARLTALQIPKSQIKDALDGLLSSAPDHPVQVKPERHFAPVAALGAVALLLVGIALGALWSPRQDEPRPQDWITAVANYQVLYVAETLASAPNPEQEQAALRLSELSDAVGYDLSTALNATDLEFRRAQMLGLDGQPLVQIVYMGDGNIPIALCVTSVEDPVRPIRTEFVSGLAAAHWVDDGFGFLVIGGEDLDQVDSIAQGLRNDV